MTLYDQLGVPPEASADDIRRAYRRKAQRAHPDRPGGSNQTFHAIQHAYDVLGDAARREKYDRTGLDREQDLQAQALERVAQLLMQAVDQLDVDHDDLIDKVRDVVLRQEQQIHNQVVDINKAISKRRRAAQRIGVKGGRENRLAAILGVDVRQHEAALEQAKDELRRLATMLSVLAEYSYAAIARNTRTATTTGSFFLGTSA